MKGLACAFLLAGTTCGLVLSTASDARVARHRAQSGLQLSIITPDPRVVDDRANLDVVMRGGAVDMLELYLDNALVAKRQLDNASSRRIISFSLDTAQLAEGNHNVLVKAYGSQALLGSIAGKLRIAGADLTAPVRISFPLNGTQVSGLVAMRVTLDSDLQRQKPYVSFFVDKSLKALKNYPPYEYVWDTSNTENGWHLLEAWTQLPDSSDPTQARPIHILVNNSAGMTHNQGTVMDLSQEFPTKGAPGGVAKSEVDPSTAVQGTAASDPNMVDPTFEGVRSNLRPQPQSSLGGSIEPSRTSLAATSTPRNAVPAAVTVPELNAVAPAVSARPVAGLRAANFVEPSRVGIPQVSAPAIAPVTVGTTRPLAAPAMPARMGGAIIQPRGVLGSAHSTMVSAPAVKPVANAVKPVLQPLHAAAVSAAPRAAVKPTARKAAAPALTTTARSIDVAFDGDRIAFDVQPRVEGGIGLAPFRQIFEHTGGRLYWYGGPQVVRAVNDNREIEMHIGDTAAKVNNKPVTMDRAPFVVKGRTLVPLKFIQDSMNVKVHFEPNTGHLLIESKK